MNKPPEVRFWKHVKKTSTCWIWIGAISGQGYAQINLGDGTYTTGHRLSWKIHFGPIPKGRWVLHKCDNRPCVNPEHLFLGDSNANIEDKVKKGRQNRGSNHNFAKLTEEIIFQIRSIKNKSRREMAKQFNTSQANIGHIIRRESWAHI